MRVQLCEELRRVLSAVQVDRDVQRALSPDGSALSPPLVRMSPDEVAASASPVAPVIALDEDQIRARTPHIEQLLLEFYVRCHYSLRFFYSTVH